MDDKKLRVIAAGEWMIPNLEAAEAGARRYIGRAYDGDGPNGEGRWAPTGEAVEVPYRAEYVAALRAGELTAADDETARLAGVRREAGADAGVDDDGLTADQLRAQFEADMAALAQRAQQTQQQPQPDVQATDTTQTAQVSAARRTSGYPSRAPIGGK